MVLVIGSVPRDPYSACQEALFVPWESVDFAVACGARLPLVCHDDCFCDDLPRRCRRHTSRPLELDSFVDTSAARCCCGMRTTHQCVLDTKNHSYCLHNAVIDSCRGCGAVEGNYFVVDRVLHPFAKRHWWCYLSVAEQAKNKEVLVEQDPQEGSTHYQPSENSRGRHFRSCKWMPSWLGQCLPGVPRRKHLEGNRTWATKCREILHLRVLVGLEVR